MPEGLIRSNKHVIVFYWQRTATEVMLVIEQDMQVLQTLFWELFPASVGIGDWVKTLILDSFYELDRDNRVIKDGFCSVSRWCLVHLTVFDLYYLGCRPHSQDITWIIHSVYKMTHYITLQVSPLKRLLFILRIFSLCGWLIISSNRSNMYAALALLPASLQGTCHSHSHFSY